MLSTRPRFTGLGVEASAWAGETFISVLGMLRGRLGWGLEVRGFETFRAGTVIARQLVVVNPSA